MIIKLDLIEVFRCGLVVNVGVLNEDLLLLLSSSCRFQVVDIGISMSVP